MNEGINAVSFFTKRLHTHKKHKNHKTQTSDFHLDLSYAHKKHKKYKKHKKSTKRQTSD